MLHRKANSSIVSLFSMLAKATCFILFSGLFCSAYVMNVFNRSGYSLRRYKSSSSIFIFRRLGSSFKCSNSLRDLSYKKRKSSLASVSNESLSFSFLNNLTVMPKAEIYKKIIAKKDQEAFVLAIYSNTFRH